MRRAPITALLPILALVALSPTPPLPSAVDDDRLIFRRGDANHDGWVDASDISFTTSFLFASGPVPPCMNEADANHDGAVNVSDAIYTSNWLFSGGPEPPAPGPLASSCSLSDSPWLSCVAKCPSASP